MFVRTHSRIATVTLPAFADLPLIPSAALVPGTAIKWPAAVEETLQRHLNRIPLSEYSRRDALDFYRLAAFAAGALKSAQAAGYDFEMPDLTGLRPTIRDTGDDFDAVASLDFQARLTAKPSRSPVRLYVAVSGREGMGRLEEIRLTHAVGAPVHRTGSKWYGNMRFADNSVGIDVVCLHSEGVLKGREPIRNNNDPGLLFTRHVAKVGGQPS